MGTPFFAAEILKHLLSFHELEIIGVVSQPDRKMSRKKKIVYSEVKQVALEYNLPLFQPEQIKDFKDDLKSLNPERIITCAYGQFLPQFILDYGVINVHASLLPKYRGGAPMQWAIMNDEKETGISLMKSILKMDAGPVYATKKVSIDLKDTLSTLELKLIDVSKELLSESLIDILSLQIKENPQDSTQVSFAPTIKREQEFIDFNRDQMVVYNHLRALIDQPYGYSYINGKRIKFTKVSLGKTVTTQEPAILYFEQPDYLQVSTKNGFINVHECQLEGKQKQAVSDLYNGYYTQFNQRRLNDEN